MPLNGFAIERRTLTIHDLNLLLLIPIAGAPISSSQSSCLLTPELINASISPIVETPGPVVTCPLCPSHATAVQFHLKLSALRTRERSERYSIRRNVG